jgi:hypothetical protein
LLAQLSTDRSGRLSFLSTLCICSAGARCVRGMARRTTRIPNARLMPRSPRHLPMAKCSSATPTSRATGASLLVDPLVLVFLPLTLVA